MSHEFKTVDSVLAAVIVTLYLDCMENRLGREKVSMKRRERKTAAAAKRDGEAHSAVSKLTTLNSKRHRKYIERPNITFVICTLHCNMNGSVVLQEYMRIRRSCRNWTRQCRQHHQQHQRGNHLSNDWETQMKRNIVENGYSSHRLFSDRRAHTVGLH